MHAFEISKGQIQRLSAVSYEQCKAGIYPIGSIYPALVYETRTRAGMLITANPKSQTDTMINSISKLKRIFPCTLYLVPCTLYPVTTAPITTHYSQPYLPPVTSVIGSPIAPLGICMRSRAAIVGAMSVIPVTLLVWPGFIFQPIHTSGICAS